MFDYRLGVMLILHFDQGIDYPSAFVRDKIFLRMELLPDNLAFGTSLNFFTSRFSTTDRLSNIFPSAVLPAIPLILGRGAPKNIGYLQPFFNRL